MVLTLRISLRPLLLPPPTISEFSQSQSILRGAQIGEQTSQVVEQTIHGSVHRVVIQTSDVRSAADVDSMDPSLASL